VAGAEAMAATGAKYWFIWLVVQLFTLCL